MVDTPRFVAPGRGGRASVARRLYDLVAVGGGTSGCIAAGGAALLGAHSALVADVGAGLSVGDDAAVGVLLRAARAVHEAGGGPGGNGAALFERVRRLRARMNEQHAARRMAELGVDVFAGRARFLDPWTLEVGGEVVYFEQALVATGWRPHVPPIEGLEGAVVHTGDTVGELTELPRTIVVLGAGAEACALAQAFSRLGARVTLVVAGARPLEAFDAGAACLVERALVEDGVAIVRGARVVRARGTAIELEGPGGEALRLEAEVVLVACGRVPDLAGLGLENAGLGPGVDASTGLVVDAHLRTRQPHIFASVGHAPEVEARHVLRAALYREPWPMAPLPRVTLTDPELACMGMCEGEARGCGVEVETVTMHFDDLDRPAVWGKPARGVVRFVCEPAGGRILGATIVARCAGELMSELVLMLEPDAGAGRLAWFVHPSPPPLERQRGAPERLPGWVGRWLERSFAARHRHRGQRARFHVG